MLRCNGADSRMRMMKEIVLSNVHFTSTGMGAVIFETSEGISGCYINCVVTLQTCSIQPVLLEFDIEDTS